MEVPYILTGLLSTLQLNEPWTELQAVMSTKPSHSSLKIVSCGLPQMYLAKHCLVMWIASCAIPASFDCDFSM